MKGSKNSSVYLCADICLQVTLQCMMCQAAT